MQILRTNSQNRRLYALLTKLNLLDMKANLALQYSNGRTSETSQLTITECKELIVYLDSQAPQIQSPQTPEGDFSEKDLLLKRKRGKVLHLAIASGFKNEKGAIDYKRFNVFMFNKSVLKKHLNDYDLSELDKLITQFGQIAKSHKESKLPIT
jgi:hypothetical protein